MRDETLRKVPEVADAAEQPPLHLAEGALRAAGVPPIEDAEASPVDELTPKPPEEPQTSLSRESLELVIAAGRGFTPRPRR